MASAWANEIPIFRDDSSGFKLFLGSKRHAADLKQLVAHGVKHVLNVADDVPNYHENDAEAKIVYKNLNVGDFGEDEGISRVFDTAIEFVEKCMEEGNPVLVHCAHGINRSATIVLVCCLALKEMTLAAAYAHVMEARPIMLWEDNEKEIVGYEKKLFGKNSMTFYRGRMVVIEEDEQV